MAASTPIGVVTPPAGAVIPGLFAYYDADAVLREASAGHREWFGVDPGSLVGRHARDVLAAEWPHHEPHVAAVLGGEERCLERTVRVADGRERTVQVDYLPDRCPGGQVRGFFVHASDVTRRVRAERDLAEAHEIAELGSWAWDVVEGFSVSAQVHRLLGLNPASWVPTLDAVRSVVHPDDLDETIARQEAWMADGRPFEHRYRIVRADGAVRRVHVRGRGEHGADGRLLRVFGTIGDVTEAVAMRDALEERNAQLADTVAMLGHDVRQPLTAVLGFLDEAVWELAEGDPSAPSSRAILDTCLERAGRAGRRMASLLDDILAMSSVDSGRLRPRAEPVELGAVLADVAAVLPARVHVRGAEGVTLRADAFHLRQVLANLLANADKYGRQPIRLVVDQDDDGVRLAVSDSGEGVPADFVPDLFERFSRARRAGDVSSGTGLGLHLVRTLLEANEGSVHYETAPGGGACFVVRLPAG